MNIVKCAFQAGGIEILKCWFLWREENQRKPENPEKNPWSKDENQQQTQPTCDTGTGNRTRAPLVGVLSPLRHPCSPVVDDM